jgi:hypothetical protein
MSQPLGNHGIDIDIQTGRPASFQRPEKVEDAQVKYHQAVQESLALTAELRKSPVMSVLVRKYAERLDEMAKQDPECQALEKILQELRFKAELAPILAEAKMVRLMGGPLATAYKQAKPAAP